MEVSLQRPSPPYIDESSSEEAEEYDSINGGVMSASYVNKCAFFSHMVPRKSLQVMLLVTRKDSITTDPQ